MGVEGASYNVSAFNLASVCDLVESEMDDLKPVHYVRKMMKSANKDEDAVARLLFDELIDEFRKQFAKLLYDQQTKPKVKFDPRGVWDFAILYPCSFTGSNWYGDEWFFAVCDNDDCRGSRTKRIKKTKWQKLLGKLEEVKFSYISC